MSLVGKSPNQRRGVSVKSSLSKNIESVDPQAATPQQVAAYIAGMCRDLLAMQPAPNTGLVAHLLAMAQAEAEHLAEQGSGAVASRDAP